MGVRPIPLLLCALAAHLVTAGSATWAQDQQDRRLSRQQILYALANTYRTLADEQFLNENRDDAAASYRKAKETTDKIIAGSAGLRQADLDLVANEIAYRQALLSLGMSFWGLEYQLRPLNPVAAWQKFDNTVKAFQNRVDSIGRDVEQLTKKAVEQVTTEVNANQMAEDNAVQELQEQSAATNLRYATLRRNMLYDRMNTIAIRQEEIAKERQSLMAQMEQASAGLDKLMVSSIASYIGLPPNTVDIVQGAAKGDISQAVANAALEYASSGAAKDFGKFGEAATTAATQYKELREKVTKAEDLAKGSMDVVRAIQSGDAAAVLNAGTRLYNGLPDSAKKELNHSLASNKTIKSAVELARQGSELRATVVGYVTRLPNAGQAVEALVGTYLDTTKAGFDRHYSEALSALLTGASSLAEKQEAVTRLAQGWHSTFVDEIIPSDKHAAVAQALGLNCATKLQCRDLLLAKLEAKGFSGPLVKISPAGAVSINGPDGKEIYAIDAQVIAEKTIKRPLQAQGNKIKAEAQSVAARLVAAQGMAIEKFLAAVPDVDFDRHIGSVLNRLAPQEQTAALQAMFPTKDDGSDVLTRSLGAFSLGRDFKAIIAGTAQGDGQQAGVTSALEPSQTPMMPATPPSMQGGGMNASQQAALQALAMSGPYGAAAAVALKIMAGIEAFGGLVDAANRLAAEDRDLTVEMLHLAPMSIDLDRDEALAQNALRIAQAKAKGAKDRAKLYSSSLEIQGGGNLAIEARIRAQLPLTFYLAELLRQEFDQLDRAVAMWNGDSAPRGRYLQSRLRDDPRTARLVLDPEIRFNDWFVRASEGERKDLGKLAQHWERLRTVVLQACDTMGCLPSKSDMGQVERTRMIVLSELQISSSNVATGVPNRVRFTLLPKHLSTMPRVDRLRLVDVSAVVRDRNTKQPAAAVDFSLVHSGLGYLSVDSEGVRETLERSDEVTPKYHPNDMGLNDFRAELQSRWRTFGGLRPLEGYPLFGLYELQVPATFDPATQEVELVFFYQRLKQSVPADTKLYQQILSCKSGDLRVNAADVQLLVHKDRGGVLQAFDTVATGPACTLKEESPE